MTNNPADRAPGIPFDRVTDINRVITTTRLPVSSFDCSSSFAFDGGRCNTDGLTGVGFRLARAMASYGSVIDIDHLSLKAKRELRGSDQGLGPQYPLVSGHAGFNEISHGQKSNEDQLLLDEVSDMIKWGGAFGPILLQGTSVADTDTYPPGVTVGPHTCGGTTEGWLQAYRYIVAKQSETPLYNGQPAFVGVGFGSDFNGLSGWPRPRFDTSTNAVGEIDFSELFVGGALTPNGGRCYLALGGFPASPARVLYPFTSPLTGATFLRSDLAWSGHPGSYDISVDGVAHVGMIPDFVEELRALGLSNAELAPLWHGAESYIRTWEAALSFSSSYGTEVQAGIHAECVMTRAKLVPAAATYQETVDTWTSAIEELKALGCDGAIDVP
jgi:microsomal dipeptidase-like Zn-dependent dipeptidase